MYEIDFLPVGDGEASGDAIAMRFTRPDNGELAHVIIDAGFQDDGEALVQHVKKYYNTTSIDLAILTHPDGDHIGGMGVVVRELDVGTLCLHRLGARGGAGLPAAEAVDDLIGVAEERGTQIHEPFAGDTAFGGALTILSPDAEWYAELVAEQHVEEITKAAAGRTATIQEAVRRLGERFLAALPLEVPFHDGNGAGPRNNSSVITLMEFGDYRALLTGDAGVPALDRAWDWLDANGKDASPPHFVQIPHHGSRHNASSAMLDRLFGPMGQPESRHAFISVVASAPRHPSPRVVNAYKRRGHSVCVTGGKSICHSSADAPPRTNWGPVTPLGPMDESVEDDSHVI